MQHDKLVSHYVGQVLQDNTSIYILLFSVLYSLFALKYKSQSLQLMFLRFMKSTVTNDNVSLNVTSTHEIK